MKQTIFFFLGISIFSTSCTDDPRDVLNMAQKKVFNNSSLNYNQKAFWPNPAGKIDTITTSIFFRKNLNNEDDYDFTVKSINRDQVNIDGAYKSVNHEKKIVTFYPAEEQNVFDTKISSISKSPLKLLHQTNWEFIKDTLIDEKKYNDYCFVESDKFYLKNKIYTEQHIFINISSTLLERFERRNYVNRKNSQTIVINYTDYKFDNSQTKLTYNFPSDYKSKTYKKNEQKRTLLKAGQKAPSFVSNDLEDHSFDLESYRGKKVLLDFSFINCGYCKMAFDHFNKENYEFANNISPVYINPVDKKKDVIDYTKRINIPFPVLANAEEIGKSYGVSVYPTFILIDEFGIIEKVISGYDKEFLDSLKY